MKLSYALLSLIPAVRGGVINAGEDCHADNCYRAVAGSDPRYDAASRREQCSSWMGRAVTTDSVIGVPTASVASTGGEALASPISWPTTASVPIYATVCRGPAAYSSACACWGVTALAAMDPVSSSASDIASRPTGGLISVPPLLVSTATFPSNSSSSAAVSEPFSSFVSDPTPTRTRSPLSFISVNTTTSTPSSLGTNTTGSTTIPTTSSSTTSSTTSFSSFTNTTTTTTSSSPTPSPTGCVGQVCENYTSWPCSGPLGDCLCGIDPTGASFCFENDDCDGEPDCSADAGCPSNRRCVLYSCCGTGKCVVELPPGAGVCGNANGGRALFARGGGASSKGTGKAGGRCLDGSNRGGC